MRVVSPALDGITTADKIAFTAPEQAKIVLYPDDTRPGIGACGIAVNFAEQCLYGIAADRLTYRHEGPSGTIRLEVTATGINGTPIGATTAATGRFTTLMHTGFLLRSLAAGLTAGTTNTQAGALGLTASVNIITTAASNSAVRLPNAAPASGSAAEIIVRNQGVNAVNCYPPSSGAINALAANASISIPAGTTMRFGQTSNTQYYVL